MKEETVKGDKKQEIIYLIVAGLAVWFIIGLALGIFSAFKFVFAFFILFYLPFVFWAASIKKFGFLEKFLLTNMLGLSIIPTIFFVIGVLEFTLNIVVFITVPIIIFIAGLWFWIKR